MTTSSDGDPGTGPEAHPEVMVRLVVDAMVCVGVGQCELLEPDVFRIGDDDGIAVVIGDGRLPVARAEVVIEKCPSGAITAVPET